MEHKHAQGAGLPIKSLLKRGEVKVLLAEHDKFLREIWAARLAGEGYEVLEAERGDDVEAALQTRSPHIVLLDRDIPGRDSFEVLRTLKANGIPVIMLANLSEPEEVERAKELGAEEFLTKANHMPQEVVEIVRRTLEKHYVGQ
ncbi:MAG: response regulator [Candidatus Ryanbacteria bacterium]|nr:response regulator [Candidatus Ryanbacteria bacterium]